MTAIPVPLRYMAEVLVSNVDKKTVEGEQPVRLVNYTDVYYNDRVGPHLPLMAATATLDQIKRFVLLVGDSIITKDSETADDIAVPSYVTASAPDVVCGYHLAIVRPRSELSGPYLSWALRSNFVRDQFSVAANGMTRYGLTYDAIESVLIPMQGPHEQQRIADFLEDQVGRIDNIITARNRQLQLISDQSREAIANAIEADAAIYGWIPLRRWMTTIDQGWSPQCDNVPAGTGEAGVLKLSAVRDGKFNPAENKAMLPGSQPEPRYRVHAGDLLMSRANTPELVGDCAVVNGEELNLYLPDLLYRVGLSIDESTYVDNALRTPRVRGLLRVIARGTSLSMAKIRGEDIRALPVPAAPLGVRKERLGEFFKVDREAKQGATHLQVSMQQLGELKRSLITAAVTGEFDVSTADGSRVPV